MTHAPGPWAISGKTVKSFHHQRAYSVARVENKLFTNEANIANAKLISAAPELLAALEKIVAHLSPFMGQGNMDDDIKQARAAINKAKGV